MIPWEVVHTLIGIVPKMLKLFEGLAPVQIDNARIIRSFEAIPFQSIDNSIVLIAITCDHEPQTTGQGLDINGDIGRWVEELEKARILEENRPRADDGSSGSCSGLPLHGVDVILADELGNFILLFIDVHHQATRKGGQDGRSKETEELTASGRQAGRQTETQRHRGRAPTNRSMDESWIGGEQQKRVSQWTKNDMVDS